MPSRTRTFVSAWAGLALLSVTAPAQQTWIVDPNGTGNFTDLHVAIQTAASGDTLLLRGGGHYTGTYSFQKHLSFVGVPPQRPLVYYFMMAAAPATSLSVAGLDVTQIFTEVPTSLEGVNLKRCDVRGSHTFLNRCTMGQPNTTWIGPGLYVTNGSAIITSSTFYSSAASSWTTRVCHVIPGQPGIQVYLGTVRVAGSTLVGAPAQWVSCPTGGAIAPAGPALSISGTGSTAWITQSTVSGGNGASYPVEAVFGTTVYHDAQTQFTPAFTGTTSFLPSTRGDGAPPGGTITCHAQTEPGYPAVLAASLGKHAATTFPAIDGNTWIDPSAFVVLVIGYADATGQLPATIAIPASAPRGLPITVQAAVAPPSGRLSAATPVVVHVR